MSDGRPMPSLGEAATALSCHICFSRACLFFSLSPLIPRQLDNATPVTSVIIDVAVAGGAITPAVPNSLEDECSTFIALPNQMVQFFGLWNSSQITGLWREPASIPSEPSPPPLRIFQLVMSGSGLQSASGTVVAQLQNGDTLSSVFQCRMPAPTTTTSATVPTIGPGPLVDFIVTPITPPAACPDVFIAQISAQTQIPLISSFSTLLGSDAVLIPESGANFDADPCRTTFQFGTTPPADMFFSGTVNSDTISGGWSDFLNVKAGPGNVPLLYIVFSGDNNAKFEGEISVTAESQVVPC